MAKVFRVFTKDSEANKNSYLALSEKGFKRTRKAFSDNSAITLIVDTDTLETVQKLPKTH